MISKLKITFMGACNAGKTAIINRIINNNNDILPSKLISNTSIFLNIENKNDDISTLYTPNQIIYGSCSDDILNHLTTINGIKRKEGDFEKYVLKTKFTNINSSLADELIIQDTPGLSEKFLKNYDGKNKYFSDIIFNSSVIYYIFHFTKVEEELSIFKDALENIKIKNPICLEEKYFKIIVNQIDKIDELINDDRKITESKYRKEINEKIKDIFIETIGVKYNNEIIFISSLKKDHKNYNKYGKTFSLLIKNIENDLINHDLAPEQGS